MIEVIPAIDLIEGSCVRLSQGDYSSKTVYSKDPVEMALRFEQAGVRRLHLVDLDGAKSGSPQNMKTLERIASATSLKIDFSGGLRKTEDLESTFRAGAAQVAVGSTAVKNPELVEEWFEQFGPERMILGADVEGQDIKISGWIEDGSIKIQPYLSRWISVGFREVLCTSISQDGMLKGPDFALYTQTLKQFPKLKLIASGGVTSIADLEKLELLGLSSAIIGKAFYEGHISMSALEGYNAR